MKTLSSNLIKITDILSDLNYHDGDTIGLKLGITRSAVWKAIKKLQELGIKILSGKNKGYQLISPLILLNKDKIVKEFSNLDIEIFEVIDSTNNYLKRNLEPKHNKICIAEMQTTGRGRMGRSWHSPFGQNIHLSYAYSFKKDVSELNGLSLAIGIACLNAIKEYGITKEIMLKWPNDGVYNVQKFMGNLVELQSESYGDTRAIIGIGINANMILDYTEITQKWTSLTKITGKYIDRNKLCILLIKHLNFTLEKFTAFGMKEFMAKWKEIDALYNQRIKLNNGEYQGIAKGINEQGNLLLELDNKELRAFCSGEASICK